MVLLFLVVKSPISSVGFSLSLLRLRQSAAMVHVKVLSNVMMGTSKMEIPVVVPV